MTLREEIAQGENVALEFKEARPKDSLKYLKTVGAFRLPTDASFAVLQSIRSMV